MINIGLCCDDNYAPHGGVCLTSIYENNKTENVYVFILTNSLNENNQKKFYRTAQKYQQGLEIIRIDDSIFKNYPVTEQFKQSIYYRFLFPELLPQINKLLYIDCDTIVLGSLHDFWNAELNSITGVVIDSACDDVRNQNRTNIKNDYFNSGVLLMNLEKWRSNNIAQKCMEYLRDYPQLCLYPDQDALNVILDGFVDYFPIRYNFQHGFLRPFLSLQLKKDKWDIIDSYIKDIVILHFSGHIKPWHIETRHPFANIWEDYKRISLWAKFPKQFRFQSGIIQKIRNVFIKFGISDIPPYEIFDSRFYTNE